MTVLQNLNNARKSKPYGLHHTSILAMAKESTRSHIKAKESFEW